MGDLERAERELVEAVDLHRDVDAPAGEAHSLQRLAEVRLEQGDKEEARRLLERALPIARWSVVAMHLLQRIYGTMILAAPDAQSARALVDQAEATLGETDACSFCVVMLAVPAAIACAEVGDLDAARHYAQVAEGSAQRWPGTAWAAAAQEARAPIARAEGDPARPSGSVPRPPRASGPRDSRTTPTVVRGRSLSFGVSVGREQVDTSASSRSRPQPFLRKIFDSSSRLLAEADAGLSRGARVKCRTLVGRR